MDPLLNTAKDRFSSKLLSVSKSWLPMVANSLSALVDQFDWELDGREEWARRHASSLAAAAAAAAAATAAAAAAAAAAFLSRGHPLSPPRADTAVLGLL